VTRKEATMSSKLRMEVETGQRTDGSRVSIRRRGLVQFSVNRIS
jgi:hypothetical protein